MKDAGLDWSCYYHIRDYYVSYDTFSKYFSANGTALMTRWWNRQPQFDGLFDYQNQIRPAYFTFKLLSRMAGETARHLHQRQGPRFRHARPAVTDA